MSGGGIALPWALSRAWCRARGNQRCLAAAGNMEKGGAVGNLGRAAPDLTGSAALADAAALGLPALAGVVAGAQDGITVVDAERRFVYANPAAGQMLGYPLEQLRGRDFLGSIPAREHTIMLARFSDQAGGSAGGGPAPFTCNLRGPDGAERVPSAGPADDDYYHHHHHHDHHHNHHGSPARPDRNRLPWCQRPSLLLGRLRRRGRHPDRPAVRGQSVSRHQAQARAGAERAILMYQ
jgi:PAS domain-containing protein